MTHLPSYIAGSSIMTEISLIYAINRDYESSSSDPSDPSDKS